MFLGDARNVAYTDLHGCTKGVLVVPRDYKIYITYGYSFF